MMSSLPLWASVGGAIALTCVIVMILLPNLFSMITNKIGGVA